MYVRIYITFDQQVGRPNGSFQCSFLKSMPEKLSRCLCSGIQSLVKECAKLSFRQGKTNWKFCSIFFLIDFTYACLGIASFLRSSFDSWLCVYKLNYLKKYLFFLSQRKNCFTWNDHGIVQNCIYELFWKKQPFSH